MIIVNLFVVGMMMVNLIMANFNMINGSVGDDAFDELLSSDEDDLLQSNSE